MTVCRGVRGATSVQADDRDQILNATRQLLGLIIRRNGIEKEDVATPCSRSPRIWEPSFLPWQPANLDGWKFHCCAATRLPCLIHCHCVSEF